MSEETAAVGKRHHGVSKFLSKDRWRDKKASGSGSKDEPLAKDKSQKEKENFTLNDDVVDFLKPSTARLRPVSPKTPRIGIDIAAAQKFSSSGPASSLPTPSSLQQKDYPRRALRLAVAFTNAVPEVIGEGGDESEEPVIEISRRLEETGQRRPKPLPAFRPSAQNQYVGDAAPGPSHAEARALRTTPLRQDTGRQEFARTAEHDLDLEQPPPIGGHARNNSFPTDEPDFVPKPIQRTLTRFGDLDRDNEPQPNNENVRPSGPSIDSASIYSTQSSFGSSSMPPAQRLASRESYQLPQFSSVVDDSPLDIETKLEDMHFGGTRKSLTSPVLQEKIHEMRAEEGETLHSAVEQDPFVDNFGNANRLSSSTTSSYKAEPSDEVLRRPVSGSRSGQPPQFASNSQYRPQISQMSTPSPSQVMPTPDMQPRGVLPSRKPIVPAPINSTLRPTSNDSDTHPSPRFSPALNVAIPNRADYFQPGPPSTNRDASYSSTGSRPEDPSPAISAGSAAYTSYGTTSRTPSNATPRAPADTVSRAPSQIASRAPSNATPGTALGQIAFDDFADRCDHMGGIFRLQADYERPIYEFTPSQWLRAASWWFLRGRAGIESMVRSRPQSTDGREASMSGQELLTQPHVDLAKTWWIMVEILPAHPGLRPSNVVGYSERSLESRNNGDHVTGELFESCDILMTNLKSVLGSMKRNGVMPPTHALIQGQDQSIWIKYPDLAPTLLPILSGNSGRSLTEGGNIFQFNPLSVIAVADTRMDFSYNRMFVKASLGIANSNAERIPLPCVVSVMRERNDWHPKVTICSQKELVTICIMGDRKRGPSWQDVKWNEPQSTLHIQLPQGYLLTVQLNEPDFRQLYYSYNHTFRVQSSLIPLTNEKIAYETSLCDFSYRDSAKQTGFPQERVKRCRIRLFAKSESRMEGIGERKLYRGFRLLAVTSPKNRVLACANHDLGVRYPTIVAVAPDANNPGLPCLTLYVQEDRRQCSMLMVFNNDKEFQGFLDVINGFVTGPDDLQQAALRLKGINIEQIDQGEAFSAAARNPFSKMQWKQIYSISKDPGTPSSDFSSLAPPDSLRVIAESIEGTVTDRINVGPGELMMRLSPDGNPDITLFRQAQEDFSITIDPSKSPQHLPNEIADVQRTVFMLPTVRTFSFFALEDLHKFQASITHFNVVYDGLAAVFTIARRRPISALSKHKKLEAGTTRLQIVAHDRQRIIQLLVFFDDMPNVDALNFQLKGMDAFERYDDKKSKGRYGVKLVDAKFTLPGKEKGEREERGGAATPDGRGVGGVERKFVNLDMLEPPAENDDIVIGFEDEQERERFLKALPAPPQVHRGLTLKRRI